MDAIIAIKFLSKAGKGKSMLLYKHGVENDKNASLSKDKSW